MFYQINIKTVLFVLTAYCSILTSSALLPQRRMSTTLRSYSLDFKVPHQFVSSLIFLSFILTSSPNVCHADEHYSSSIKYLNNGMSSFRNNNIQESIHWFEKSQQEYSPIANQLWQKGISQYFASDYNGCLEQFQRDIPYNPNDTEEAIWSVLCASQLSNPPSSFPSPTNAILQSQSQSQQLSLIDGKTRMEVAKVVSKYTKLSDDPRPIMRIIGNLFLSQLQPNDNTVSISASSSTSGVISLQNLKSIVDNGSIDQSSTSNSVPTTRNNLKDYFYASLYLSLYEDMIGDIQTAKQYAQLSVDSTYATSNINQDYMIAVAKVNLANLNKQTDF